MIKFPVLFGYITHIMTAYLNRENQVFPFTNILSSEFSSKVLSCQNLVQFLMILNKLITGKLFITYVSQHRRMGIKAPWSIHFRFKRNEPSTSCRLTELHKQQLLVVCEKHTSLEHTQEIKSETMNQER